MDSTERGGAGPSAAEGAPCACRATATVLRGCASMHEATRRARGRWAALDGVASWLWLRWSPQVALPPQKLPTPARLAATDARNRPSVRAGCWPGRRGCVQRARAHCGRVTESDEGRKITESLNFLNLQRNSAAQVFDIMFLASGDFSLS